MIAHCSCFYECMRTSHCSSFVSVDTPVTTSPRPPVYVRWWPLVRTLSLRPAAGVPLAALWDFHTLNWNVWNSRCHFRKLFTLGEPCLWVWVYVCMCVFYYRSTSDHYRFSLGLSRIKSCLILLFGIFWLEGQLKLYITSHNSFAPLVFH